MTPAIIELTEKGIDFELHNYEVNPNHPSYGEEAAEMLCVAPGRVFKTLVIETSVGQLSVAVIPVIVNLHLKKAAVSFEVKKAKMADPKKVERTTGYVLGGVSPIGQKKSLTTLIERSAQTLDTIFVSAGKRGLEIELAPADLLEITGARYADLT